MSKPAPSSLKKASQSPWGRQALVRARCAPAVFPAVQGAKNKADGRPWLQLDRSVLCRTRRSRRPLDRPLPDLNHEFREYAAQQLKRLR